MWGPLVPRKRFYAIHDWDDHQPPEAQAGQFFRVYTKLDRLPKWKRLSAAERGLLVSFWVYRCGTGLNPEVDRSELLLSLNLDRSRHIGSHLERLQKLGWIEIVASPRAHQRRVDKKREEKTPPTPRSRGARPSDTGPPGFRKFWSAYPSKTGRTTALASWRRKKLEHMAGELVAAVEQQKGSEKWQRGVIPNPSTWLNQGRWEDEIAGATPDADLEWFNSLTPGKRKELGL